MPRIADLLDGKENPAARYARVSGLKEGEVIVLRNGDYINVPAPELYYRGLAEAGFITTENAEEMIAKQQTFVKAVLSVNKKNVLNAAKLGIEGSKAQTQTKG